jgi:hypothetical protein
MNYYKISRIYLKIICRVIAELAVYIKCSFQNKQKKAGKSGIQSMQIFGER